MTMRQRRLLECDRPGSSQPKGGVSRWFKVAPAIVVPLIAIGFVTSGCERQSAISRNPEAVALCEEGTAHLHAFRLRAAVETLGLCLQEDPSLAEASISRALAYTQLGERQSVKQELARADSLTAALTDEERRLIAQLRLGSLKNSRFAAMRDSIFGRLQNEAPDNIYVLIAEAENAMAENDDAGAERIWKKIVAKDLNYANSYNMLGYLELNRGNYQQAIEYMQKYAFVAPKLANPHDSLGEVLMVLGRYEEAEAEFRTSVAMQPDFYHSLINLGSVYLARGELDRGLDILEKFRSEVAGTELEMRVDREIISTYLKAGLEHELGQATAHFIARYPDQDMTPMYRAVRLIYLERAAEGRAVMDSSIAHWRDTPRYMAYEKARQGIDSAAMQYEGMAADLAGDHRRAAESWAAALRVLEPQTPRRNLFYMHYRLAAALRADGQPRKALAEVDPLLATNPRMIEALLLKVRCHLDLGERELAAKALEQLEWSLAKADPGYPAVAEAAALKTQITDIAPVP